MDDDKEKSVAELKQWLTLVMANCVVSNEHEYSRAVEKFGEDKIAQLVRACDLIREQDEVKFTTTMDVVKEEVIEKNKSITSKCMTEAFELAAGVVYKGKL